MPDLIYLAMPAFSAWDHRDLYDARDAAGSLTMGLGRLFFLEDLTYDCFYRISHETRFFWASHGVHHSSQKYNLGTAL